MSPAIDDLPPFPGIRDEGLDFLEALREDAHQNRDCFNERKLLYTDELRWPLRCLVSDVVRHHSHIVAHPVLLKGDVMRRDLSSTDGGRE